MDNKDCDNIDEDEWYAGLGVVPLSSEKTSSAALARGSSSATGSSARGTHQRDGDTVVEEGANGGMMLGDGSVMSGGSLMSDAGSGLEPVGGLNHNQRDRNAVNICQGSLSGSGQGQLFDSVSNKEASGSRVGQNSTVLQEGSARDMVLVTAMEEEEDDDDEDLGGVILADEVNSRSYTNVPYGKGPSMPKHNRPVSFVRRDRVVFLGSPPELPLRVAPDPSSGGAMTRVGSIIVLSNLMWWVNDISIRELASEFGTVRAIRIIERPKDGRSLGICLIEYVNSESAPKALQGISASFAKKFDGRPLYVVPLPLHGELHIALDNINPHWSRGGIITEEILAMICQLVGVDIQTAGLEIQPETGTIVGLVQPRFADYASYFFPDGTPSWFPPLYVEALKHIRDLIPPSRLQNRSSSGGGGGSSSKHSTKNRSNYTNNDNNNTNYSNMESDSDALNHLDDDSAFGVNGESKDSASFYNSGTGDNSNIGSRRDHDSGSGKGLNGSYMDDTGHYGSGGGRGSKSLKYENGFPDNSSGGNNGDTLSSYRDDDEHFSGGTHNSKKFAGQKREYRERERQDRDRGERDRERGDRDRDRGDRDRDRGDRDRDRGDRDRERERDRNRDRDRDRDRDRNRDRDRDRDRERERDRVERSERGERDRNKERSRDKSERERSERREMKSERGDKEKYRDKDWERERDRDGDQEKWSGGASSQLSTSTKEAGDRGGSGAGGSHSKKGFGGSSHLDHDGASSKSSSKKHRSSSESSRSRSPPRRLSKHVKKDLNKFSSGTTKDKSWDGRGSGGNNSSRGGKNSNRESRSLAERGGWERRSNRR
ncbi:RNA binding RGG repeats plus RRM domain-containing protein [Cryptosporidium canis]|uniref:RNA binding RGG repeats plus RRM domain-containing protein n=1 Tax=Cryptosporidium canis TaxID=195482 RepID=A0A9D5DP92_9CRYT|nr:RNA binding RGG repeats plus RRM domain-containing protein [Cryptosporidium canis]